MGFLFDSPVSISRRIAVVFFNYVKSHARNISFVVTVPVRVGHVIHFFFLSAAQQIKRLRPACKINAITVCTASTALAFRMERKRSVSLSVRVNRSQRNKKRIVDNGDAKTMRKIFSDSDFRPRTRYRKNAKTFCFAKTRAVYRKTNKNQ